MTIGAGGLGNNPAADRGKQGAGGFLVKFDRRVWRVRLRAKMMKAFPDKSPAETPPLEFDCSDELGDGVTIEQATVKAYQLSTRGDDDPTPDAIRMDDATLDDTKTVVIQKVNGGVDEVTYKFIVTYATSDGRTLEGAASLRVRSL